MGKILKNVTNTSESESDKSSSNLSRLSLVILQTRSRVRGAAMAQRWLRVSVSLGSSLMRQNRDRCYHLVARNLSCHQTNNKNGQFLSPGVTSHVFKRSMFIHSRGYHRLSKCLLSLLL